MSIETIYTNARLVLEDEIIEGTILVRDGRIARIDRGQSGSGEDLDGDYILPGLVELHTDHLERHYSPRPGLRWDLMAALQSHDAQIASSGITTVFDCLRLGSDESGGFERGELRRLADALEVAQADNRLRAEHRLHLRCEVSAPDVLEHFADFQGDEQVGLASLMDHSPGQRQFQSMELYTFYYKVNRGLSDQAFDAFVKKRQAQSDQYSQPHRETLARLCREQGITLASHDDATEDHVDEALEHGVRLAEFPTSIEAARASHGAGMSVLMGAPNVVRGKSHSGNIAAKDLAEIGVLDVLSSDYVPFSLIHAPFILADTLETVNLPQAIAMVTATPARTVGLDDRGRLAEGLRADLVRVRRRDGVPVVRGVWREGQRVA
jgi:alpha-D-ribose 1-methylphosphonate 5-triphosphate diphosphatase